MFWEFKTNNTHSYTLRLYTYSYTNTFITKKNTHSHRREIKRGKEQNKTTKNFHGQLTPMGGPH